MQQSAIDRTLARSLNFEYQVAKVCKVGKFIFMNTKKTTSSLCNIPLPIRYHALLSSQYFSSFYTAGTVGNYHIKGTQKAREF